MLLRKTIGCGAFVCVVLLAAMGHADIYRWDNGEMIPGTEGINAGAGGAVGPSRVGTCSS